MQLFSADAIVIFFFDPEKVKKRASKVAHNQPNPFFSQSSPDHSPQPRIDFLILNNIGTRLLFSLTQTLLFHSPAQTTAHRPELIFHIMKSWDQTSVLLSVPWPLINNLNHKPCLGSYFCPSMIQSYWGWRVLSKSYVGSFFSRAYRFIKGPTLIKFLKFFQDFQGGHLNILQYSSN